MDSTACLIVHVTGTLYRNDVGFDLFMYYILDCGITMTDRYVPTE